jgi:mannose/fructose/N-acetylgalactosamine-specific phosphotransferase system component IIC
VITFAQFALMMLFGVICSLDTVSVAQMMVSRPIVSATLGAAALGRPADGIIAGAVMELFALETMPFGASRYPEWGSAGVVAGATFVIAGSASPGALAMATFMGLITASIGSISMVWHREAVAKRAGELREELAAGSAPAVARLHGSGIMSDVWRGALVTLLGLVLSIIVTPRVLSTWGLAYGPSLAIPVIVAVAVGGASLARSVRAAPAASWLLVAGLIIGSVVVAVTR